MRVTVRVGAANDNDHRRQSVSRRSLSSSAVPTKQNREQRTKRTNDEQTATDFRPHSLRTAHCLPTHSHSHSLTHSRTPSPPLPTHHSLTHSLPLPLTHSHSLTPTHSLTHCPPVRSEHRYSTYIVTPYCGCFERFLYNALLSYIQTLVSVRGLRRNH